MSMETIIKKEEYYKTLGSNKNRTIITTRFAVE
jgi:hypothetical protein